jgi:hypothetical protein
MNTNTSTPKETNAPQEETGGGWMRRLVRFLRDAAILITCIAAILRLAKCPGNLEWWRPICIGLILPIIKRFL